MVACYASSMLDLAELAPEGPRLLTRKEYQAICETGVFDDERVELLHGVVVRMSPPSPPHEATIQRLNRLLVMAVGERGWVRINSPWAANDDSLPEPDVVVAPLGDYDLDYPERAWLVIEVSKSSLRKDRGIKARLYARAGVPEYWVVNLVDEIIEAYTEPAGDRYVRRVEYRRGEQIRPSQLPNVEIAVSEVLPAPER